ncbi:hypothetical protein [Rubrivivax gelatinosus]|uniref:hypothetical protein n=1 Tax=Rubrivivax gelatinosus TaxID=28068 RepID=UPI001902F5CC|nr:hypothetical protein [Rubrivivax gelatinosus]
MDSLVSHVALFVLLLIWLDVCRISKNVQATLELLSQTRRDLGLLPPLSDIPSDEVLALAADPSRRIEAIRRYREHSGADVKVAIAVVDRIRATRGDD